MDGDGLLQRNPTYVISLSERRKLPRTVLGEEDDAESLAVCRLLVSDSSFFVCILIFGHRFE